MFRKRIISFLLVFAIVISLFGSLFTVSAASTSVYLYDTSTVEQWNTWVENNFIVDFPGVTSNQFAFWRVIDRCFVVSGVGDLDSKGALQQRANNWNNHMNYSRECWPSLVAYLVLTWSDKGPWAEVAFDADFGVYRLRDRTTGIWLVDSGGRFPYYCETSTGDIEASTRQDQWLPFTTANSKKQVSVLTKDSLSDLCLTLNQTDRTCSVRDTIINEKSFYVIIDTRNNIYANADGVPYVAHYEATVTDQGRDYIINEGDTLNEGDTIYNDNSTIIEGSTTNYEIVDNSKVVDLTNGTLNYIGEQNLDQFYIDELLYDFSSQSYSADTYNVTYDNDTYNTWNYTWNITYNITNTYVTNIGQTELYKPLELYYALPDGRSSADLTAEEIAGMSFEFADCVNYAKSATDTYLRALYHFDGNTDDSSYFSTQGKFEWLSGASIEYMDVGTFDGALYLGPENHQFNIVLPSYLGSGDFTLQFRYYQAGSADTQSNVENSVSLSSVPFLQWDEGSIYDGSGAKLTSLAVGIWQEFAIMRLGRIIYFYHNGLLIGSISVAVLGLSGFNHTFTFSFGSTTRAYSMIDELRVVNKPLFIEGDSFTDGVLDYYTPTSVPYDTNAVLALPDSAFPIADEYWVFDSSVEDEFLEYQGLNNWVNGEAINSDYLYTWTIAQDCSLVSGLVYDPRILSIDVCSRGVSLSTKYDSSLYYYKYRCVGISDQSLWPNGIFANLVNWMPKYNEPLYSNYYYGSGTFTFSMVDADGNVGSITYNCDVANIQSADNAKGGTWLKYIDFNGYRMGFMRGGANGTSNAQYICAAIVPWSSDGTTPVNGNTFTGGEFVYLELALSDFTDLSAEFVNCMYSSEEVKPNTAAIQTDIPINGYTVGGVRPTFPARGDVWMPVNNNRITNVYVYNGSAWEEVNARWYTGTRWIPIYGFDITTLEDCWDIADIDTTIVMIGSESQFWSWLQGAWQKMLDKLDAIIIALGGDPNYSPDSSGGGGTGLWDRIKTAFSDALASIIESLMSFITDVLQLVLDLVYDLLSFFFDFLSDEVITGIANLFSSFTDGSLLVFFQQEITSTDEDGNEVTTTVIGLPDGIATAFAFFAGVIMILPEELRNLLIFGVGALILIGILKLAKS